MLPCIYHCLLQSGGRSRVALRRCDRADPPSKTRIAAKKVVDALDTLCALLLGAAQFHWSHAGLLARVRHLPHSQRLENSCKKHRNFRNRIFQGSYSCLTRAVSVWSPHSVRTSFAKDASVVRTHDNVVGNHQHIQTRSPTSTCSNSSITSALNISTQPLLKG